MSENNHENSATSAVPLECFVRPDISPANIVLRKWHDGNKEYSYCTLRELWENGFSNGQSFQKHNQHKKEAKYMNENGFHVKSEFFDEVWKAFWSDFYGVEIIIKDV